MSNYGISLIIIAIIINKYSSQYTQQEDKEFYTKNSWEYISSTLKQGSIVKDLFLIHSKNIKGWILFI